MTDRESTDGFSDLGLLTVRPSWGTIGEWGTWTVRYTAGARGVATGGAVQVELPRAWHQWLRNSSRAVQATRPNEPFYVSARAWREGVRVRCEVQEEQAQGEQVASSGVPNADAEFVKRARTDLAGLGRRYAWVLRVTVEEGRLALGDSIDVRYGDRSGGSRGFTPPLWATSPDYIRGAVDADASGRFVPLPPEALPLLSTIPGEPAELAVVVPSTTAVGEEAEALVVALDANLNPTFRHGMRVEVRVVEGDAALEALDGAGTEGEAGGVTVTLETSQRLRLTPRAAGAIRLRAQSADGRLYAHSNPSRAHSAVPAERLYWGDLHGHTQLSWDATGLTEDAFQYARDVSGLQVYGNADHGESLSEEDWGQVAAFNAKFYAPGRFVTLVGYENSQRFPFGHHNVFYRGAEGRLLHAQQAPLDVYLQDAVEGEALVIPHHMIALGSPARPNTDWALHDPRFHRVAEIYSGHGQSELHAEDHPLASDVVDFTLSGPAAAPSSLRDGWMRGHKFGVIASSDNHVARPGREGFGVMGIYAEELTREGVFDALQRRRTFGSTGCRVLLDFEVNGTPMGGEHRLREGEAVHLTGEITGSGALRFVEILRGDLETQEWRVARRWWWAGGAPVTFALDWTDPEPLARGLYYVRLRQRELVHGRVAMAWSSPVWVER